MTIGSRPTSCRWSANVTPEVFQRVAQKRLFCFLNKIQFQSKQVCYKVSLCENFQQQSYSITIPLFPHLTVYTLCLKKVPTF